MFGLSPGPGEMLVIGIIALLLFGKRLPEVAKNVGKSLGEFKRSVSGFENEIRTTTRDVERRIEHDDEPQDSYEEAAQTVPDDDDDDFAAPKFKVQA